MNKKIISAVALMMLAMPAFADELNDNSADGLLQAPQQKLVEKACCSEKKAAKWIPNISGHIQLGYFVESSINPDDTKANTTNSFELRHARVTIKGAPEKWFDYRLQVEFSSPKIMDAEIKFHPLCNLEKGKNALNFWVGQSKTPLTLENPYGPTNFEVIDNAQVVANLVGYNQTGFENAAKTTSFGGGRDLGAAAYGSAVKVNWGGEEHDVLEYKLGIYNGSGMNVKDIDNYKTIGGNLYFRPLKPLMIGGSFMNGRYKANGLNGTYAAAYHRAAASFRYDDGKHWMARAEYIFGHTDDREDDGWYAALQYTINPNKDKKNQWAVVAKYDGYRTNLQVPDAHKNMSNRVAAGVNYWPTKWMYVQAIYTYTNNQKHFSPIKHDHKFQLASAVLF